MRTRRVRGAQPADGDLRRAGVEGLAQPAFDEAFGGVFAVRHIRPSRIRSSASRARLAFDFTAPRLIPRVVAISASLSSAQ